MDSLSHGFEKITIAFRAHLNLRPVGLTNAVRLCIGYLAALPMKFFSPGRFESMGYLIPGKSNVTVSVSGFLARVRPRTNDLAILVGSHEPRAVAFFRIKPGDTVIDVGAHIGSYTLSAAGVASKIVAIEPDPSNYSLLKENIRLNAFSNVIALQLALSRNPGTLMLYVASEANRGTSSLERKKAKRSHRDFQRPIEVQCDSLDRLAPALGLEIIDWLKIDVEGHELSVLEGARSSLMKTNHLILEVSKENEKACRTLLEGFGLTLVSSEQNPGAPTSNWLLSREEVKL